MAYTLVQSKAGKGNSGTSVSVTGLTATTAGNLLLMIVDGEKNPGDVTFTPPANWVQVGATQHQDIFIAISGTAYYYPNNPGGITSVAVTASSALSAWHCYFLEFSGVATSSPLDAQAVTTAMATTAPSSGNITTTQAGDLLIGWISEDDVNGAYTLTQPGGWTALARNQDAGQWTSLYVAYKTAGAAGTESYAPTLSSTATDSVIGVMAFLASGGGGGSGVSLTASAAQMLATTAVSAALSVAVALAATSPASAIMTAPTASLSVAVALSASPASLRMSAAPASLSVAVTLAASPAPAVLATSGASLSVAVALSASPAVALLSAANATLAPGGGQLTAQPARAVLTAATATLSMAVALSAQPAVTAMTAQAAAFSIALTFAAQAALAQLTAKQATIGGASTPGAVALSDARTASATLADALVDRASLADARIAVAALSDA